MVVGEKKGERERERERERCGKRERKRDEEEDAREVLLPRLSLFPLFLFLLLKRDSAISFTIQREIKR